MSKKNPTRAEREAIAAYAALQQKWASVPKFARRSHSTSAIDHTPKLTTPPGRSTGKEHQSLDTGFAGGTKPLRPMKYTGTKLLGIGTLHKSNAVPVFSQDEAIEISTMRRG